MEINTKTKLLDAYDKSKTKTIADICRRVGVSPTTYYFHFSKDKKFRRALIEKRRTHLTEQIEV